jgi:hypothetical protein
LEQGTTLLLGLPGVAVSRVERRSDGTRVVHVVTGDELAGLCPGCGIVSTSLKEAVATPAAGHRARRGRAGTVVAQASLALPQP